MTVSLEAIRSGAGAPTREERDALEAVAEASGKPKVIYQVYDDTDAADADMVGTEKAGGRHATSETAVEWAKSKGLGVFSVYRETRCITRQQEIWYMQGQSAVYSAN